MIRSWGCNLSKGEIIRGEYHYKGAVSDGWNRRKAWNRPTVPDYDHVYAAVGTDRIAGPPL